jgi:hypothetical protein
LVKDAGGELKGDVTPEPDASRDARRQREPIGERRDLVGT